MRPSISGWGNSAFQLPNQNRSRSASEHRQRLSRTSRARVAPNTSRTAISSFRAALRASSSPARLAHTISSSKPTEAISSFSALPNLSLA
jgi:hypothetical protein